MEVPGCGHQVQSSAHVGVLFVDEVVNPTSLLGKSMVVSCTHTHSSGVGNERRHHSSQHNFSEWLRQEARSQRPGPSGDGSAVRGHGGDRYGGAVFGQHFDHIPATEPGDFDFGKDDSYWRETVFNELESFFRAASLDNATELPLQDAMDQLPNSAVVVN